MKYCKYCGNSNTKLDHYGYCKKYNCITRAGITDKIESFEREISNLYLISDSHVNLSITSYVTNTYNPRTRAANDIVYRIKKEFGFVPMELYERIPIKNREQWDKSIKW